MIYGKEHHETKTRFETAPKRYGNADIRQKSRNELLSLIFFHISNGRSATGEI